MSSLLTNPVPVLSPTSSPINLVQQAGDSQIPATAMVSPNEPVTLREFLRHDEEWLKIRATKLGLNTFAPTVFTNFTEKYFVAAICQREITPEAYLQAGVSGENTLTGILGGLAIGCGLLAIILAQNIP
jgi:hypothetical protein